MKQFVCKLQNLFFVQLVRLIEGKKQGNGLYVDVFFSMPVDIQYVQIVLIQKKKKVHDCEEDSQVLRLLRLPLHENEHHLLFLQLDFLCNVNEFPSQALKISLVKGL